MSKLKKLAAPPDIKAEVVKLLKIVQVVTTFTPGTIDDMLIAALLSILGDPAKAARLTALVKELAAS